MSRRQTAVRKMNQLNISGNEVETVISCGGEGWSPRVRAGLIVGLIFAAIGAIITLALATAAFGHLLKGLWHESLLFLLFAPVPVCMGGVCVFHFFRLGWNSTTVRITGDFLSVDHDGKLSKKSYRVPLSEIKRLKVRSKFGHQLVMRLGRWRNESRTILQQGSIAELHSVEDLIRSRLADGGWSCG